MSTKILLRKTSTLDYPGRVSSVLFFSGCNLRCPWCHNRELVMGGEDRLISPEDAFAHIKKRRSVLGGVVLSGGEPCLWNDLPDYVREIKNLRLPNGSVKLSVKLDTNGMFPAMLEKLFSREETTPDYVALDLKIAPFRYAELLPAVFGHQPIEENGDTFNPGELLRQSAALIRQAGITHEYRTLALPCGYITEKDIEELAPLVFDAPWHFRPFRGGNCLDSAWDSYEEPESEALAKRKTLAKKAVELGKNGMY